jgi:hypothetical protein
MKAETHKSFVKSTRPPVVEIDSAAQAVYVRFKIAKVARPLDTGATSMHIAIDLDANNEVTGVEAIGLDQFNIEVVLKKTRVEAPASVLKRARYITVMLSPALAGTMVEN